MLNAKAVKKRIEDYLLNRIVNSKSIIDSETKTNPYCLINWLKYPEIYQDIISLTDDLIKNHKGNNPGELFSGILQVLFTKGYLKEKTYFKHRIEIAKFHFKTDISGYRSNPNKGIKNNEEIFNKFSKKLKSLTNSVNHNSCI